MKANYAKIRSRYCEKMREQVFWGESEAGRFVPVHGRGIGPVSLMAAPACHSACPRRIKTAKAASVHRDRALGGGSL
jgi:hypothetical protein